MVWALDLDNSDSQSAQFLKSGGIEADSKGFTLERMRAQNKQKAASALAYWTPCMSDKDQKRRGCPARESFLWMKFKAAH